MTPRNDRGRLESDSSLTVEVFYKKTMEKLAICAIIVTQRDRQLAKRPECPDNAKTVFGRNMQK